MMRLGVLVPPLSGPSQPPDALPIGRAALDLAKEGVEVVFGHVAKAGGMEGLLATPLGWAPAPWAPVASVHDRFPSQSRPELHRAALRELVGVAVANGPGFMELCRDKLESQRCLERAGVPLPEVVHDPALFADALSAWGGAFLKPRFGSFGHGVARVTPGDALPARSINPFTGLSEGHLLQRAISPPRDWAGVSVRALVQRVADAWVVRSPVVRRSAHDPVVNAARGAEVAPAFDVLGADTLASILEQAHSAALALCAQLPGQHLVEVGVDLVVDRDGRPWCIEVNGRPRGRLQVLATRWSVRFEGEHRDACEAPLRWLVHDGAACE